MYVELFIHKENQNIISVIPIKNADDGNKIGSIIKNLYPEYKVIIGEKGKVIQEVGGNKNERY